MLQVDAEIILTRRYADELHKVRKVCKVQTNGVYFIDPSDPNSKRSFMDFPKSTLVTITDTRLFIYNPKRETTPEGREVWNDKEKGELCLVYEYR